MAMAMAMAMGGAGSLRLRLPPGLRPAPDPAGRAPVGRGSAYRLEISSGFC
jgi:hypothetical protein